MMIRMDPTIYFETGPGAPFPISPLSLVASLQQRFTSLRTLIKVGSEKYKTTSVFFLHGAPWKYFSKMFQ